MKKMLTLPSSEAQRQPFLKLLVLGIYSSTLVSVFGTHLVCGCGTGSYVTHTHNAMVDVTRDFGQSAGCRVIKEVKGLFQDIAPDDSRFSLEIWSSSLLSTTTSHLRR